MLSDTPGLLRLATGRGIACGVAFTRNFSAKKSAAMAAGARRPKATPAVLLDARAYAYARSPIPRMN
jgi:hypothetical protein